MNEIKNKNLAFDYARTLADEINRMAQAEDDEELRDYWISSLDEEFIVGANKKYKYARILVTAGGPTAWINTLTGNIECYWGMSEATYPISETARELLDEWSRDYYEMEE